jgi:ABC-type nitrate/sulfonate/bicarbonate transport system ATPase subunit
MLRADKISFKRYHNDEIRININNLNFDIDHEKITCLVGHSGVGKSTIAGILAGLIKPDSGSVYFCEEVVKQPHTPIAMVLQDYKNAVFPWLTVEQNIMIGRKKPINRYNDFLYEEIVSLLGIGDIVSTYPYQLSGGQIQRVQIGRALYTGAKYIILDEPASSLDMRFRNDLQKILTEIRDNYKVGSLMITHNIEEATLLSDYMYILSEGNNKIIDLKIFNGYSGGLRAIKDAQKDNKYIEIYEKVYNIIFS